MSNDTEIVDDKVCGFLGILQIHGLDHFVIATESNAVCELPTYKQPGTNATAATIYALKKVRLIPFFEENKSKLIEEEKKESNKDEIDSEEIRKVVKKIQKYLKVGFYFAYNYDLTSNLQR